MLTGGSGGRPLCSAATAEPLHTLWLQPNYTVREQKNIEESVILMKKQILLQQTTQTINLYKYNSIGLSVNTEKNTDMS